MYVRTFVFLCSKEQTAMPIRTLLLSLWWLLPAALHAQQVLVCDGATRFPIRDVLVSADGKPAGQTTWQGRISLSGPFQTVSFQKKGYVPEKLLREEVLRDTVFLFPAAHYLDEVVVVGKQTVDGRGMLKKMPKRDILEKRPPSSLGEFDLGLMLDKRYRRDRRHVEQLREIFKKMDGLDEKEDPVLKAYRQTQLELKADSLQQKNARQPSP